MTGASTPTAPGLRQAITDAANGTCASNPVAGDTIGANNGMIQTVVDLFEGFFIPKYNESLAKPFTFYGPKVGDQPATVVYQGGGWEVFLPLIQTDCPPKDINQSYTIQTFSKFVFTQVINHGDCVVNNPADTNSAPLCGLKDPSLRAIFGYFDCAQLNSQPTTVPTPRAALATRLRLVCSSAIALDGRRGFAITGSRARSRSCKNGDVAAWSRDRGICLCSPSACCR